MATLMLLAKKTFWLAKRYVGLVLFYSSNIVKKKSINACFQKKLSCFSNILGTCLRAIQQKVSSV